MAQVFDSTQLKQLSDEFSFFQYRNGDSKLQGQYFAISQDAEAQKDGDGVKFAAVIKAYDSDNPAVQDGEVTAELINQSASVRGSNAALTVSKTHPKLIRFLLNKQNANS